MFAVFHPADYTVLIIYLGGIIVLGSFFSRRQKNTTDFFLAGRSMHWMIVGISIFASLLSAISYMGVPALAYGQDMRLFPGCFGYLLVLPVIILVFLPFYARLRVFTIYEYLERRFSLAVRVMASILFICLRLGWMAGLTYLPSLALATVTGMDVKLCVLLIGLSATFYTTLGGMKAVIWTDVAQFVVLTGGLVLVFVTVSSHVDGGLLGAWQSAAQSGKLDIFTGQTLELFTTEFSLDKLGTFFSKVSFPGVILMGMISALVYTGADQVTAQRYLSTKNLVGMKRSVIVNALLSIPLVLLMFLAGAVIFVFYAQYPANKPDIQSVNDVLPYFVAKELPIGISGLIIAAIFAAAMSSFDSGLNSMVTAITVDFYQRLIRPDESPQRTLRLARTLTAIVGILITGLAILYSVLGGAYQVFEFQAALDGYFGGALLGVFLLGMLTRRASGVGVFTGVICGTAVTAAAAHLTELSFVYYGVVGCGTTIIIGYLVSLLSTKPRPEQLKGLVFNRNSVVPRVS